MRRACVELTTVCAVGSLGFVAWHRDECYRREHHAVRGNCGAGEPAAVEERPRSNRGNPQALGGAYPILQVRLLKRYSALVVTAWGYVFGTGLILLSTAPCVGPGVSFDFTMNAFYCVL